MSLSRRDLLRLGTTGAVAAGAVGLGFLLKERGTAPRAPALAEIRDHRLPARSSGAQLAIARGPDAAANVRRVVEALGGMRELVRPGERVLVKPNVGWNRTKDQAANTDPDVVAEVVRLCVAAGAGLVVVADHPVNDAESCFERSGIRAAALQAGARVVLPTAQSYRQVAAGGHVVRVTDALDELILADRVINVPVAKVHGLSGATLSIKNWIGVVGSHRARLHQDIHRTIVDLSAMVRSTLTVLDATRVLVANGPSGGSLSDVRRLDTVAASRDEVALDAFGAGLLGLDPAGLAFLAEAERRGLGTASWRGLRVEELGT